MGKRKLAESLLPWSSLPMRKIVQKPGLVLVVLFGLLDLIEVPEKLDKWIDAVPWLPNFAKAAVQHVMLLVFPLAWAACVVLVAWWALRALAAMHGLAARAWAKWRVRMARGWVKAAEARQIVELSDFATIKGKAPPEDPGHLGAIQKIVRGMDLGQRRTRDQVVRERFVAMVLREFAEYDPDAVKGDEYDADVLSAWLDRLTEEELAPEIGRIPKLQK